MSDSPGSQMSTLDLKRRAWRIPGFDWLANTLVVAVANAGFYWYSYWRAGWEAPHIGTYLCAVGAILSFVPALREIRDPRRRWACLLGLSLSGVVLWHIFTTPCIGPCK
jgi:hypothetical protein